MLPINWSCCEIQGELPHQGDVPLDLLRLGSTHQEHGHNGGRDTWIPASAHWPRTRINSFCSSCLALRKASRQAQTTSLILTTYVLLSVSYSTDMSSMEGPETLLRRSFIASRSGRFVQSDRCVKRNSQATAAAATLHELGYGCLDGGEAPSL